MVFDRMPFGKYKGWPLEEVPDSYLSWLIRNCNLRRPLRESVQAELRERLRERNRPEVQSRFTPAPQTPEIIRRWYRDLALRYHPDRGGSVPVMQALNYAHDRLKQLMGVAS